MVYNMVEAAAIEEEITGNAKCKSWAKKGPSLSYCQITIFIKLEESEGMAGATVSPVPSPPSPIIQALLWIQAKYNSH